MRISRGARMFLLSLLLAVSCLPLAFGQGVADAGREAVAVKPLPEGGAPPAVQYRDLAQQAGLRRPNVSGGVMDKTYLVETTGTGVAIFDFDNDGLMDLFFVNSGRLGEEASPAPHYLYRNLGNLRFEDVTEKAGIVPTGWGQGVCAGDVDNDGYTDQTVLSGLAVVTRYVGWGAAFLDFDHDGRQDIFAVNGHVSPGVDGTPINESFRQPRLLFWNSGDGAFHPVSSRAGPAFEAQHSSRGVAVGDLDNDGSQEIVVVNMNERPSLLKHSGDRGNWLLVRALTRTGRDAIGARISVTAGGRTIINEVRSGGGYISQDDFRVHFGLGDQGTADVVVRWPAGAEEKIPGVKANQRIEVREGEGIVAPGR